MELKEMIEKILTGNCILFTGSGFSFGAKNVLEQSPKIGGGLTEFLYKECDITENDFNLKSASEIYSDTKGEFQLIEVLRKEYTIKEISSDHEFIASIPWKRIYTTNYDNVMELAFINNKKLLTPITLNERIDHYKDKRTVCVHLNGYIERLTPSALYKDFKLTNSSYLTTDFINSSWIDLFRDDFESSSVIVFIGFSMNDDLDLSRIISTLSKRKNVIFVIKPGESKLNIKKLEKFGVPLDVGLNGFVAEIKTIRETFSPPEFIQVDYKSFSKVAVDYTTPKQRDIDNIDLLFKGNVNKSLVHYSLLDDSKYKYYIKRKEIDEVVAHINEGGRNILIHSDLGNGKTLFLNGLSDHLANLGFDVYYFKKYFDQTSSEIEQVCASTKKTVLIFENYSSHFDILKRISLFRTKDTIVIASERSTINDTVYFTLEENIFNDAYLTKDLNILKSEEALKLSEVLTTYGLWGKYASLSTERKRLLIMNDCNSSFRLLLLLLLDSPDIKDRFNSLLLSIREANESFFNATLLILASNIFDFQLEVDDLIYILDDELLNNPAFHNNDRLMEIIDFNESRIKVRSSILAQSLLIRNQFHNELIELLVLVVTRLDRRGFDKNNYRIIKSIVSFSRLQSLFNLNENPKLKPIILNFFEEIKNTYFAKKNPFFWLQYAIARLSTRDYPISDLYFKTAYSFADQDPDFDTFQIDNHYARHILENEIYNGDLESCMEQFLKAHNLLYSKSDINQNRHYPLRVAILYGKFYDKFFAELKEQDKVVFLTSCNEIFIKVSEYKKIVPEFRWNKSVLICEKELNRIKEKEKLLATRGHK